MQPEFSENPRVEIETTAGTFTVTLRYDLVPRTVENFLWYVDQGFYDGTIIHQVIQDYAILGGNYKMDGDKILLKDAGGYRDHKRRCTRSQQRTRHDRHGPQGERCPFGAVPVFSFNLVDNTSLDYTEPEDGVPPWQTAGYCAFGKVDGDGMAVLDEIAQQDVCSVEEMNEVPVKTITIKSIPQALAVFPVLPIRRTSSRNLPQCRETHRNC